MKEITNYISKIELKVLNIKESESFYDSLFEFIPLKKKEDHANAFTYWSSFGLVISQQDRIKQFISHDHRVGVLSFSLFCSEKEIVDNLYKELGRQDYKIHSKPKFYDYAPGYYSFKVFDPDENLIEIFTTESDI